MTSADEVVAGLHPRQAGHGEQLQTGRRTRHRQASIHRTECCPQSRQDLLSVQPQEPLLVRARRVEHEMTEAQVDIGSDPLHMLVRIAWTRSSASRRARSAARPRGAPSRADPPPTSSPPAKARAPPSGGCPPSPAARRCRTTLSSRSCGRSSRAARPAACQAGRDVRQQRLACRVRRLAAGADEALGHLPGILRDHRAGAGDVDRHGASGRS